jgi:guanylate kinase
MPHSRACWPSPSAKGRRGLLLVVSAPSGTGKTTVCRHLLRSVPGMSFSVSCTTRARRPGERHGRDYYFITEDEFRRMIRGRRFLEWARVHGNLYGTPRDEVYRRIRAGRHVVLDIDVQGGEQVKRKSPEAVLVFLVPPSWRELRRRLANRRDTPPDQVRLRLKAARAEMRRARFYDYVVVNDRLSDTVASLAAIIVAETHRQCRRPVGIPGGRSA